MGMTPEKRAETLAQSQEMLKRGGEAMMRAMAEESMRARYFYLGYTREEERVWSLYNRCCHPGRKIRLKAREQWIRVGNPTVRVPKSRSHAVNIEIIKSAGASA